MESKARISQLEVSTGSNSSHNSNILLDQVEEDGQEESSLSSSDSIGEELNEEQLMDDLFDGVQIGEIDSDKIMSLSSAVNPITKIKENVSAAHANQSQGISAEHLSKVWRIELGEASKTIDVTSQHKVHTSDPKIAKNYGTNDRMLRYRHIKEYFFMDTMFATRKGGKSIRGNICGQLFVSDCGFTYFVPMRSKSDVLLAVKQFAKEIGVPDAIICDGAGEQKSNALRNFCHDVGTTLRLLERGTPWANKAELYIGILKEAVRKDMR